MTDTDSNSNPIVIVLASLAFVAVWLAVYAVGQVGRKVRAVLR